MQHMKIPWDIEDAKLLGRVLDRYKDRYFFEVLLAVVVTYILYPFPYSLILHVSNYAEFYIWYSKEILG
jgi:hypothetical protein